MLKDQPMRLWYYGPAEGTCPARVIDAGWANLEADWYDDWLDSIVKTDERFIFYFTTETTDVFELAWDFNEVTNLREARLYEISLDKEPNAWGETIDILPVAEGVDMVMKERTMSKGRENYTWDDCTKDLAILTHMTHAEALQLTYEVSRRTEIHPYDALPVLRGISQFMMNQIGRLGASAFAEHLIDLVDLAKDEE